MSATASATDPKKSKEHKHPISKQSAYALKSIANQDWGTAVFPSSALSGWPPAVNFGSGTKGASQPCVIHSFMTEGFVIPTVGSGTTSSTIPQHYAWCISKVPSGLTPNNFSLATTVTNINIFMAPEEFVIDFGRGFLVNSGSAFPTAGVFLQGYTGLNFSSRSKARRKLMIQDYVLFHYYVLTGSFTFSVGFQYFLTF